MRKIYLLFAMLLCSVGTWAKLYTPGSRVTTLTTGTKYLIYNTSMGNSGTDDRAAFIGGGTSTVSYYETKPANFITSDVNNVWTLTIEDGKYYLQCGDGGKYAQGNSKDLSADKVEITIEDFLTSSYMPSGDVYSEKEDGTVIKLDKEDSSTGTGLFCIRKDGTCWNGNPSAFATWSAGHPYSFYTVNEIDDDEATTAFNAITGYTTPNIQSYAQITSVSQLYGSNSDSDEGQHLEYLIDFNNGTYYHTSWHSGSPATADDYIQIELPEALASFQFYYVPRNASSDWPSTIKIEGCNTADGEYSQIASITDLPTTGGTQYYSSVITSGYKYLRVKCTADRTYWHMAEFNIYPGALVSNLLFTKPTFTASSTAAEIKAAYTDEIKRVISNASNLNNLIAAVNKAKTNGVADATITANDIYAANANYATSISTLNTAVMSALTNNSVATVVAGKYRIINAKTTFNGGKALSASVVCGWHGGAANVGWDVLDAEDPNQIWTLAAGSADGTFTLYNEWNGKYITSATSMTETAKDATFTNLGSGSNQYNITLSGDSNPLHANLHGYSVARACLTTWGGGIGEPSAWYIIPVTDATELAAAQAKYATANVPEVTEEDKFTIEEGAQIVRANEIGNEPSVINDAIDVVLAVADPSTATVRQLGAAYVVSSVVKTYKNALSEVNKSLTNIVVTVKANKFGTVCLPCIGLAGTENFKVYSCSALEANGTTLDLTEHTTDMAANTPYIVKNETGNDMKFQFIGWDYADGSETKSAGYLTGVLTEDGVTVPADSYILAIQKSTGKQAFYHVESDVKCPQYKCYLTVSETSGVKAFYFPETGEETVIENVFGETETGSIYNLAGQKLSKLQKGINIVNGKKIMVK